jgi:hypothetical protein
MTKRRALTDNAQELALINAWIAACGPLAIVGRLPRPAGPGPG